jgi:O-antigen/teichoic acid export membrane protein
VSRRAFSWALSGNLAYVLCQWGALVLLARIGRAETVGQFALALSISAPVFVFFQLNMRTLLATDARGEYPVGDYLRVRLALTILALAVVAIVLLVAGYSAGTAAVVFGVALFKAVEAVSDIGYGLFLKHERFSAMAASLMVRGLTLLAGLGLGLWLTGRLFIAVVSVAALWLVLAATLDLPRALALEPFTHADSGGLFWRLLATSTPLGLVMTLGTLSMSIPQYVVEHSAGAGQLGYFAAIAYFVASGRIVVEALAQSSSARLSRFYVAADFPGYRRLLWRLMAFGTGIGTLGLAVAVVMGRVILELAYGPEYAAHHGLLIWVMVAATINQAVTFLGLSLTVGRFVREMLLIGVFVATSVLALSCWLVPRFGIEGAGWALVGGAIVNLAAHLAFNHLRIGLYPLAAAPLSGAGGREVRLDEGGPLRPGTP